MNQEVVVQIHNGISVAVKKNENVQIALVRMEHEAAY